MLDDRLRRSHRHEHASHGFRLLLSNADVFESRHIGQRRRTLLGGDCKRAQLALLDQVDVIAKGGADDRRVPTDQRLRHGPPPWNGTVTKSRPRASLSISIDSDGEFSDGLHHMLSCAEENGCLRASMLGWNTGIQLRGTDGTNRGTKLMRTGRPRCK